MAKVKEDYIYRSNANSLKEKVKTMLNNVKYADTMFLVNDQIYHTSSHLVAVSSTPLETMINTHFEICGDREIKIRNIKFTESFNIILKCIYGLEINLTKMNAAVMYEVLCLSESYELVEFATEIKTYLTTLEDFNVDSVVPLLNTAKKLNMKDLYGKLTMFAYKNTEKIVKHPSFQDVHYDVLIDLLPSDWFYAKEIDILSGILTWHSDMYNEAHGIKKDKIEARNVNSDTNKSEDGNFVICTEKEGNSDQQTEVSSGETVDTSNDVDTAFAFDGKEESDVLSTPNNDTANDKDDEETNSEESGILMANSETKIDLNLVRTFSDNILKSLLAHIRISQISMMDLNIACELDMFEKYKTYFRTNSVFSQTLTPRCEHTCGPCVDISKPFKDLFVTSDLKRQNIYSLSEISKTYTVSIQNGAHFNQSKEEYSILKDLKLQLIVLRDISQVVNTANLKVSLYCNPNSRQTKYECTGKCQVTLLSQSFQYPNIVLHRPVTFTPNNSIEKFQFTWNWDDRQAYYISVNKLCKSVAIEVEFKSLEIKLT